MSYDNNHQDKDLGTNAAQYYERCIALRIRKLGFEHHSVAAAYRNLADVYYDCCDNLEEAITNAKEYIDSMSGNSESNLAQRKEAAAGSPERATTSSSVLTIDKMKNMSPQELMKIPKEIRQKALRGG